MVRLRLRLLWLPGSYSDQRLYLCNLFTCACLKQVWMWSLYIPTACMKA